MKKGGNIALYGTGAIHTVKGGTGSGDVNERDSVNIYQGLVAAGYHVTTEDWFEEYNRIYREKNPLGRKKIRPEGPEIKAAAKDTAVAVYILNRIAGEGHDRKYEAGDFCLTEKERQDIHRITELYESVVLVINTGGQMDLSFMDQYSNIDVLIQMVQAGMEGGNALADIISGDVTPSGKLADTWPVAYKDYPNAETFSHRNGDVFHETYEEGIYVGYRYFDSFRVSVRYCFGYGLSYTEFALKTMHVEMDCGDMACVNVQVSVTNIGDTYSGKEVVQVYVSLPVGSLDKEYRRLCGFTKTNLLAPGEEQIITIRIPVYQMASYCSEKAQWVLEAGIYGVWVGSSLEGSHQEAILRLDQKKVLRQVRNICPLPCELEELSRSREKQSARYGEDMPAGSGTQIPEIQMDLSQIETEIIHYDAPYEPNGDLARKITDSLSIEQLCRMATGEYFVEGTTPAFVVPGVVGKTSDAALPQGIVSLNMADGPAGLRLARTYSPEGDGAGQTYYQYCTAIPVASLLAQSWDEELIAQIGDMIAEEMVRFGITLWLAPGMNIHRNPLCGRNFEYYSEDPLLSGKLAAAMTKGVQRRESCGTTIKHFACNNQEDNRFHSDSIVSERALREIYLKGFEIAVKESGPKAIMTSYNLLNGVHTANSYDLCTQVARQEWGHSSLIMTDWWTTHQSKETCSASGCMRAGNDLVMPGLEADYENLREELARGSLTEEDLRLCVTRLVRLVLLTKGTTDQRGDTL